MNPVEELLACKYLYLHEIVEPEENGLRLIVREAQIGEPPTQAVLDAESNPEIRRMLSESRGIEHRPGCKVFEIYWPNYVGYSVRDESYALPEPDTSEGTGRLFVEYTRSLYLEYLSRATFADSDYPGPFKHWALYCQNHCVDVASTKEPTIEVRYST